MKSHTIKFGEIFNFLQKSKLQASKGLDIGQFKFFTSSAIQKKWINEATFEKEALIFGSGGAASIHYINGKFSTSTDCFVAELKDKKSISTEYVYYFLMSNLYLLEQGFQGAGLKHISKKYIEQIQIPLPSIDQQNRIAAILNKAYSIKVKREQSITTLYELKSCAFSEMLEKFNNDVSAVKLNNVCNFVRGPFGGALKKEIFKEEGYAVYEQQHAIYDQFNVRYFVDHEKFKEMKRFELKPGDLIMSCSGVTLGKVAIVPAGIKQGIINQALLKLTPSNNLNVQYLKEYMQSSLFQISLRNKTHGAAIKNVASVAVLKDLPIALPTMKVQDDIINVINKIFKMISLSKIHLEKEMSLIASLQHQAFTKGFDV